MVTIDTIATGHAVEAVVPAPVGAVFSLSGVMTRLKLWWRRRRTRAHLCQLTELQLRDVGLTPDMAEREIRKSKLLLLDRPFQPPF
ncbi:uncharacterized protein YjiS (DUF1127 family) [Peteryoungia aggregata LMG 23059]|uniref:Uncharacterized protein YjiS (DUF1127 family) n=1 Tax=Peteryoungia aggregata LMG 23059 TaxID=1368425 RepID=A0ABU0GA62_9HYPH|nr:DUF1127 domain-containing protein [Peteryoungia aggregata]MDQ0421495.1 uncharacterized protein YjiS (DUF1127 family) [Peteryoungia aggregata LMG 23059]